MEQVAHQGIASGGTGTEDAEQLRRAGNGAFRKGEHDKAFALYSDALASADLDSPSRHLILGNRAAVLLKLGRSEEALTDAMAATTLQPQWDKAWHRTGLALHQLDRPREAAAAFHRAATLSAAGVPRGGSPGPNSGRDRGPSGTTSIAGASARGSVITGRDGIRSASGRGRGTTSSGSGASACASAGVTGREKVKGDGIGSGSGGGGSGGSETKAAAAAVRSATGMGGKLKAAAHSGARPGAEEVAARLPPQLRGGHVYRHSRDGSDENLLLLLHGLGDIAAPFAMLAARMALPQTATLALAGPVTVPETDGGRAWFEAFDEFGNLLEATASGHAAHRRADSFVSTLQLLQTLISNLAGDLTSTSPATQGPQVAAPTTPGANPSGGRLSDGVSGWPRRRIHLFGFSQGGTVALHIAALCTGNSALGSCAAVSAAMLPEAAAIRSPLFIKPLLCNADRAVVSSSSEQPTGSGAKRRATSHSNNDKSSATGIGAAGTPVLITHGDADTVVARSDVDATVELLNSRCPGSAEMMPLNKAHGMISGAVEMRALMSFWARHLGAAPPAPAPGEDIIEITT
mmetsp:Transcript_3504/g.10151  ORF Transcript_3504/g.10151 Transcript_3504/m.10151 type:complete len:576 (-) Transcript_3504:253-1980(-)|eukprot:CAMPEP_0206149786 /NCGR_PEP_ID=MMETSP1473-20131121/37960_1 /ASSEMBLY_ACC=CAM_ASM_001109 /TAXON_ID=1461547 /ORGANISM="Stichococcus sp, Strain RCC1054" /LENGTH=575 /DNA_ID=CAMNT_0053547267 /DNA_START=713 /DNA_END=2440 /DNA_ORIENTATION=+